MTDLQTILLLTASTWAGAYLSGYCGAIFTRRTKRPRSKILKSKIRNWSISFSGFGVKV